MIPEIGAIAAAVVQFLAPYTPLLLDMSKTAGTKLAETIGEKGGGAAWETAQTIWKKITTHFQNDAKVQTAANALAIDPTDDDFLKKLAKILAERLEGKPDLAQELADLLGGQQAIHKIIAERRSWIEDIVQSGAGEKIVHASDDSTIKRVKQQS
jgi:hypothetical protein